MTSEQYWVVMRRDDAERGYMDGLQVVCFIVPGTGSSSDQNIG